MNVFIMEKIKNTEEALALFEKNAIKYVNTCVSAKYRACNKAHAIYMKCVKFLKQENKIDLLLPFLEHENISVKCVAASVLLPEHTKESEKILKWIKRNYEDTNGLLAKIILDKWRKEKRKNFLKKLWPFN